MKHKILVLISIFVLFIFLFFVYSVYRSWIQEIKYKLDTNENFLISDQPKLDSQLQSEIGVANGDVYIRTFARDDNFVEFALTSSPGGGVEVVTEITPKGALDILWTGQGDINCAIIQKYNIPIGLEPECALGSLEIYRWDFFSKILLFLLYIH